MKPKTATMTKFGNLAWSTTQLISETSVVTPQFGVMYYLETQGLFKALCKFKDFVSESRNELMAWMETDYSKHNYALSLEDEMAAVRAFEHARNYG